MKRYRRTKRQFYFVLFLLLIMSIGVGYSVLTERLTIDTSISYTSLKWNVGFSTANDNGGSVLADASISEDGKSLSVSCEIGMSFDQESCIVKATIVNNGTFDVVLSNDPIITYDDNYIHTITFKWNDHPTYDNKTVLKDNFIRQGESEEVILTIKTKFLTFDTFPTEDLVIPITVDVDFVQWEGGELPEADDLAVLKSNEQLRGTAFLTEPYYSLRDEVSLIRNITFENEINVPSNAIESWDISEAQNRSIVAYVVASNDLITADESNDLMLMLAPNVMYDLVIQSDKQLYANEDMSYWFSSFKVLKNINNFYYVDTSIVTDMSYMFAGTGRAVSSFSMDLTSFDTSNVTDMSNMFFLTGKNADELILNLSGFDTSKVTYMSYMFFYAGLESSSSVLDVSNWDTSNVINMSNMFEGCGRYSTNFILDVSNFDTSSVVYMNRMFSYTGYNSTNFVTSITVRNPNINEYDSLFEFVATKGNSKITVNYTKETSDLVDKMIATKSEGSNVVKGIQVD